VVRKVSLILEVGGMLKANILLASGARTKGEVPKRKESGKKHILVDSMADPGEVPSPTLT